MRVKSEESEGSDGIRLWRERNQMDKRNYWDQSEESMGSV